MPLANHIEVLATPVKFKGGLTAPNRIIKSAMSERLCTYDDVDLDLRGKPTPEYLELYRVWGEGRLGIIITGNIAIHREHLQAKRNAIIDKDSPWDPTEAFKPVMAAAKAHGSLVIGQLTHGGRLTPANVNLHPTSASESHHPPSIGGGFANSRALTIDEIHDLVERWAYGAEVLYNAGADGVQLHSAHGYLLSQFLSPRVNKRTDQYGGSIENRSRIIFEIIAAIKKKVTDPKFIISVKYNSHDFIDGGFSVEDSRLIATEMEAAGVDLIELTGGTMEYIPFFQKKDTTIRREGFFVGFAEHIQPNLIGASVLAVTGGFRTLEGMVEALSSGKKGCDMIGLGRPLVLEPQLIAEMLSGKTDTCKVIQMSLLRLYLFSYVLWQRGEKQQVPDLSDEKFIQEFVEIARKWYEGQG